MRIQFVNEHGMEEAGIDGGGLFKDFMEHLVKEARSRLPEIYFKRKGKLMYLRFDGKGGLFKDFMEHMVKEVCTHESVCFADITITEAAHHCRVALNPLDGI